MARKVVRLKDRTLANDIKYKAPLSYRYLRIIGWFFLIVAQIGMMAKINIKFVPSSVSQIGWVADLGDMFMSLPLPLFLLANFAAIFQKKDNWKKLLMFYGGVALLLYIVANAVVIHYGYGFVNAFAQTDFMEMAKTFGLILFSLGHTGLVLNIFIDLFLCSLVFFFMNYTPKNLEGKKVYLFRALVVLPIMYEIASILIKYYVAIGAMPIPFFAFFLLTSKPPFMFIAFIVLVVAMKIREYKALQKRKGEEFYEEHIKTNAHSLRFSIIIAIVFFVAGLLDLITNLMISIGLAIKFSVLDPEQEQVAIQAASAITESMGFGNASILMLIAPIALLFSYTKTHANTKIDSFIPIIGVALIIFVYIEGMFQIAVQNIPIIVEKIKDFFSIDVNPEEMIE